LERLFDNNDVVVKLESGEKDSKVLQYNVASEQDPKHVNLASHLTEKQRDDYGELLKEFADIFTRQYDDLKTFDTEVIQQKIPLNKDTKPFRKKFRSFNPLFLPTMEREIKKCWMPASSFPSGIQNGLRISYQSRRRMGRSDSTSTLEI
jgi:hypothetical protein